MCESVYTLNLVLFMAAAVNICISQGADGQERLAFHHLRNGSIWRSLTSGKWCNSYLRSNHFPSFITLQTQPFLLVARGLVKVSRRVLFASTATRAGVLIAVLASRSPMMRGSAYFRADLDLQGEPKSSPSPSSSEVQNSKGEYKS